MPQTPLDDFSKLKEPKPISINRIPTAAKQAMQQQFVAGETLVWHQAQELYFSGLSNQQSRMHWRVAWRREILPGSLWYTAACLGMTLVMGLVGEGTQLIVIINSLMAVVWLFVLWLYYQKAVAERAYYGLSTYALYRVHRETVERYDLREVQNIKTRNYDQSFDANLPEGELAFQNDASDNYYKTVRFNNFLDPDALLAAIQERQALLTKE